MVLSRIVYREDNHPTLQYNAIEDGKNKRQENSTERDRDLMPVISGRRLMTRVALLYAGKS
jgi:hypothetical protein